MHSVLTIYTTSLKIQHSANGLSAAYCSRNTWTQRLKSYQCPRTNSLLIKDGKETVPYQPSPIIMLEKGTCFWTAIVALHLSDGRTLKQSSWGHFKKNSEFHTWRRRILVICNQKPAEAAIYWVVVYWTATDILFLFFDENFALLYTSYVFCQLRTSFPLGRYELTHCQWLRCNAKQFSFMEFLGSTMFIYLIW